MGNMQAGPETFNQQPCSPGSCHSVKLAKALRFVKAAPVLAKKGHCSNLVFEAVNRLAFWTPKGGPPQLRWKLAAQTKPNFDPLASCEELRISSSSRFQLSKMGLPSATAFHFGQGHSEAVFNLDFNSRRDQKWARQIHTLERVATLFLGLRHDARNAPSCFKSSPETMKPQKGRRMTQTSMCWTGGAPLWESKFYVPFQPQKRAWNKSNILICRPELTFIRLKNTSVYTVYI